MCEDEVHLVLGDIASGSHEKTDELMEFGRPLLLRQNLGLQTGDVYDPDV